jgi:hypothetical protein
MKFTVVCGQHADDGCTCCGDFAVMGKAVLALLWWWAAGMSGCGVQWSAEYQCSPPM